jgi:hypothetical protein
MEALKASVVCEYDTLFNTKHVIWTTAAGPGDMGNLVGRHCDLGVYSHAG